MIVEIIKIEYQCMITKRPQVEWEVCWIDKDKTTRLPLDNRLIIESINNGEWKYQGWEEEQGIRYTTWFKEVID